MRKQLASLISSTNSTNSTNKHLRGSARAWYLGRQRELMNWPLLRQAFYNTFLREIDMAEASIKMKNRVQNQNVTLSPYFHNKLQLCKNLSLNFIQTKEQIIAGLKSRDIMLSASAAFHENELFADFERLDRMVKNVYKNNSRVDRKGVGNIANSIKTNRLEIKNTNSLK